MSRRKKDTTKKQGKKTPLQRRAVRDVRLMTQPQTNAINREETQTQQDFLRMLQQERSAYGGYQNELGQIPGLNTAPIASDLQSQLAQLSGLLGGTLPTTGLPGTESTAGSNLGTVIGAGALETLASQAARGNAYQASAGREGALAERSAKENLVQDLQDALLGYSNRRLDVADQMPLLIKQRIDELRDLAQSKAQDQALADYLMGTINSQLSGGGRGGGPGGGSRARAGGNKPKNYGPFGEKGHAKNRRKWGNKPGGSSTAPTAAAPQTAYPGVPASALLDFLGGGAYPGQPVAGIPSMGSPIPGAAIGTPLSGVTGMIDPTTGRPWGM